MATDGRTEWIGMSMESGRNPQNAAAIRSNALEVPFGDHSGSDLFEPSMLEVVAARANRYDSDCAANLTFRFDVFEQRDSDRVPFVLIGDRKVVD